MKEINKYEMYKMQFGICDLIDEVDKLVNELKKIDNYDDVEDFVKEKFDFSGERKIINYSQLKKMICVQPKENAIEFFAIKDNKAYFSKGWRK